MHFLRINFSEIFSWRRLFHRRQKNSYSSLTTEKNIEPNEPLKNSQYVEIFFVYPLARKGITSTFHRYFFKRVVFNLDRYLSKQSIFCNKEAAINYARFFNESYVILRAFVLETAIQGQNGQLTLKSGYLTKHHLHGFYPADDNNKRGRYVSNPIFYHKILKTN